MGGAQDALAEGPRRSLLRRTITCSDLPGLCSPGTEATPFQLWEFTYSSLRKRPMGRTEQQGLRKGSETSAMRAAAGGEQHGCGCEAGTS